MSSLKYQLRELLPSLSAEAARGWDREVKRRYYLIKGVVESKKSIKRVCERSGVSRENFYKWGRRLLATKSLEGLKSVSRRPKYCPNITPPLIVRRIKRLKKRYSFIGPDRISFSLKEDFKSHCPPSTVYGILKREDLIRAKYRKRRSKKHMKRYRRPMPGYLQMDFKYVPYLVNGEQYYQLSAVDHCSSWRLIRIYKNKGVEQAFHFLTELQEHCPFPIIEIQTDNDVAFTDKFYQSSDGQPSGQHWFDIWCGGQQIKHKLIPPGIKELNGKVENTHKYDDEEFYSQHQIQNENELNKLIMLWEEHWNYYLATKALQWLTPSKIVEKYILTLLICALVIKDRTHELEMVIKRQKKMMETTHKKTKLLRGISRYFAWMQWDAAQYSGGVHDL